MLKDDESISHCRFLLSHPLTIEDDMRLVSTVELIAIRERVHNALAPFEGPVKEQDFEELRQADVDFQHWYHSWDEIFSRKYEDAGRILCSRSFPSIDLTQLLAFYRQSLQIQQIHAQLFHNATALRGLNGPEDVQKMPEVQRALAIRSIQIACRGLDITLKSAAYREGMRYGEAWFAEALDVILPDLCPSRSLHACYGDIRCFVFASIGPSSVSTPDHRRYDFCLTSY